MTNYLSSYICELCHRHYSSFGEAALCFEKCDEIWNAPNVEIFGGMILYGKWPICRYLFVALAGHVNNDLKFVLVNNPGEFGGLLQSISTGQWLFNKEEINEHFLKNGWIIKEDKQFELVDREP